MVKWLCKQTNSYESSDLEFALTEVPNQLYCALHQLRDQLYVRNAIMGRSLDV